MRRFSSLCGVPVHWGEWGRTGTRQLEERFLGRLEGTLALAFALIGEEPSAILSGGAYVRKPGYHGTGQAFDLSGLDLGGRRWALASGDSVAFAAGLESALRLGLPQVLGPSYDHRHEDHYHVDAREAAAGFLERSLADVRFLQWALCATLGEDLAVDGVYGPRTREAVAKALFVIDHRGPLSCRATWAALLLGLARIGLGALE